MKLIYPDYNYQIIFKEQNVNTVVIENEKEFTHLVGELLLQCDSKDGRFVLSDENKILKISTNMLCVINPLSLTLNSKKAVDKIYDQLQEVIQTSELYLSEKEMYSKILEFIQKSIEQYDYPLVVDDEIESRNIFKLVNLRWSDENDNLLDSIIDYMKINCRLLNYKVFAFVNLKSFLTTEELELLFRTCLYEKYNLLLIESTARVKRFDCERVLVIDKDCCEIY